MSTLESRCLDAFPSWLKSLADDVSALGALLGADVMSESDRRRVAGAVNYLFKSLDLIPDGIEDLGFVDDAFVLRVSAATIEGAAADKSGVLARLARDADLVREFLGTDYGRLESYVDKLQQGAARGRTVDDIVAKPEVCASLLRDLKGWGESYTAPGFTRDEKNLVKLKSFLRAKLP